MQKGPRVDSRFSRGAHVEILFSCFLPSFFFFFEGWYLGVAPSVELLSTADSCGVYITIVAPLLLWGPRRNSYMREKGAQNVL